MRTVALSAVLLFAAAPSRAVLYESPDDPAVQEFRSLLIRMIVARNEGDEELYQRLRVPAEAARETALSPREVDPISNLLSAWNNHHFNYLKVEDDVARMAYHARTEQPYPDLLNARCRIYVMFRRMRGAWRVGRIGGTDCFARSPLPPPHSSIGDAEFRLPSDW